ncbi:hypothetical protein D3C86_2065930 [compost metagenome]
MTLIKLAKDEKLVGLERVQEPSEEEGDELLEGDEAPDDDAVEASDAAADESPASEE